MLLLLLVLLAQGYPANAALTQAPRSRSEVAGSCAGCCMMVEAPRSRSRSPAPVLFNGQACSTGPRQGPILRCICGLPARWRKYSVAARRGWISISCAHAWPHPGGCGSEAYDTYDELWTRCICEECCTERRRHSYNYQIQRLRLRSVGRSITTMLTACGGNPLLAYLRRSPLFGGNSA